LPTTGALELFFNVATTLDPEIAAVKTRSIFPIPPTVMDAVDAFLNPETSLIAVVNATVYELPALNILFVNIILNDLLLLAGTTV